MDKKDKIVILFFLLSLLNRLLSIFVIKKNKIVILSFACNSFLYYLSIILATKYQENINKDRHTNKLLKN